MNPPQITVYGIPNCDTVKKARVWLTDHGIEFVFHDYKKQGVPEADLNQWLDALGWEALVNRQGTTWRKLEPAAQASIQDAASARIALLANPSLIKRPVVDWGPTSGNRWTVGFKTGQWDDRIKP